MSTTPRSPLKGRFLLLSRVLLVLLLIAGLKVAVHHLGWEVMTPNRLFSALVASDVFLLGFLLSGVLADYKESERLPSELGASLECLSQEIRSVHLAFPEADVRPLLTRLGQFGEALLDWLHGSLETGALLGRLDDLYPDVVHLSRWNPFPLQARLLLELANLRRATLRIETIRRTSFVPTVYLLAYVVTICLCGGLIVSRIAPFGEAFFFIGVISFLVIFLLLLIGDLDNPFNYSSPHTFEDIALPTLEEAVGRVAAVVRREDHPPRESVEIPS